MSCGAIRPRLALFSGGDLFGEDARAVQSHLDVCAACRREAGELAAVRKLLQETAPAEFSSEELSEVRRRAWRRIESLRAAPPSWPAALLKAAAFAAAALFAAAVLTERPRTSIPAPAEETITSQPVSSDTRDGRFLRPDVGADAELFRSPAASPRASGRRVPGSSPSIPRLGAAAVRLEFATSDPDVRIVWLDSPDESEAIPIAPETTDTETESEPSIPTEESR
jgi:hypothetical protein